MLQCYVLRHADYVMSHDRKRTSDWTRQEPVAEQLAVRDFTRPSFSQRLKGVACETRQIRVTQTFTTLISTIDRGRRGIGNVHYSIRLSVFPLSYLLLLLSTLLHRCHAKLLDIPYCIQEWFNPSTQSTYKNATVVPLKSKEFKFLINRST